MHFALPQNLHQTLHKNIYDKLEGLGMYFRGKSAAEVERAMATMNKKQLRDMRRAVYTATKELEAANANDAAGITNSLLDEIRRQRWGHKSRP